MIIKIDTAKAEAAAKADIDKKRRGIARNKSIYTQSTGLTPIDKQSSLAQKTLLGE